MQNYLNSLYFRPFVYQMGTMTRHTCVASLRDLEFIAIKCFKYNLVHLMRHLPILGLEELEYEHGSSSATKVLKYYVKPLRH